jgi:ElaB/YqjD/DUF883 family membrane-anchored ribosome-binding protein
VKRAKKANKKLNRAQDKSMVTADQAEEAIRPNPLSTVAIAFGLGFLYGGLGGQKRLVNCCSHNPSACVQEQLMPIWG